MSVETYPKAMQFKAQIRNLARKNHVPAQAVLQNFMLERLLERISVSRYKDQIILKGGMLIASLVAIQSRTTMDMDATLRGYPLSEASIRTAFTEICAILLDDGVIFTLDHIAPIRDDDTYGGYRAAAVIATFESIHTPLKIDITAGDVITPGAVRYPFPSTFEDKRLEIWAYNIETILAEKIETILRRGVLNTRPRDFYDVYTLTRTCLHVFDKQVFLTALQATCRKRMSQASLQDKEEILAAIQADATMKIRWERYTNETPYASGITFDQVLVAVHDMIIEATLELPPQARPEPGSAA